MTSPDTTETKAGRRPLWNKLLLLLGSCVGSLLLGELLVRIFLEPPEYIEVYSESGFQERLAAENRQQAVVGGQTTLDDCGLFLNTPTGWRLRANTVARVQDHWCSHRDITVRTNSLGFRNPEIGPRTRPRVLFLGDSIVLGEYLDEDETFVRRIEQLSQDAGRPLETINAGVSAIGLQNELAILIESGVRTDPDVVVICFYLNDAFESPGVRLLRVPPLLSGSHLVRHAYRAVSFLRSQAAANPDALLSLRQLKKWRDEVRERFPPGEGDLVTDPPAFNAALQHGYRDYGVAWSDSAWERMRPVFHEFRRQARIHGFRLMIVAFPIRGQVIVNYTYDYPQRKLEAIAREIDAPFLDLLPLFRQACHESSELAFYDHCHHTPYGNQLIAKWILAFLLEHLD